MDEGASFQATQTQHPAELCSTSVALPPISAALQAISNPGHLSQNSKFRYFSFSPSSPHHSSNRSILVLPLSAIMTPSVLMDTSDDFVMPTPKAPQSSKRTLLLSPPSLSSHQEKLTNVLEMHNRAVTDMQMLDRLSVGLVSLPQSTYDVIMILSDADGSRRESQNLINRDILALLVKALKTGGHLRSQDGQFGNVDGAEKNEAILAGLSLQPGVGFVKPDFGAQATVPLKFGKKKTAQAAGGLNTTNGSVALPLNGKRKSVDALPAGVGFDDGANDSADELIDEDTLMDDEDLKRPINIRKSRTSFIASISLTFPSY